jgi:hypothetical protein
MAARAFFLPGIVLLFCAFILSLLVAISLPTLPTLDIVRCHFTGDTVPHVSTDTESIKEIRVKFSLSFYCTPTTLLILLLHFASVGSLVFGEKTPVTDHLLPIKLTRRLGTGRTAFMMPRQAIALASIEVDFINLLIGFR